MAKTTVFIDPFPGDSTYDSPTRPLSQEVGATELVVSPPIPRWISTGPLGRSRTPIIQVFDISFFGNISSSTNAQIRSTMRYFDLIDDQYVPTDLMRDLVSAEPVPTDEESEYQLLLNAFGFWRLPLADFYAPFLHRLPSWDETSSAP